MGKLIVCPQILGQTINDNININSLICNYLGLYIGFLLTTLRASTGIVIGGIAIIIELEKWVISHTYFLHTHRLVHGGKIKWIMVLSVYQLGKKCAVKDAGFLSLWAFRYRLSSF